MRAASGLSGGIVPKSSGVNFLLAQVGVPAKLNLGGSSWRAVVITLNDWSNHVCIYASNAGSWCAFRTPDPFLESQDGTVHLRPSQQDPHHQPGKDRRDVRRGGKVRAQTVREEGHHPVRGD